MSSIPTAPAASGNRQERNLRTARLASGLVMMTFVVMHLANLALSLVSLEAAEAGLRWFIWIWRSPPGTLLLYGSVAIHVALVLRTLYLRRTLVMPAREACQIVLGLLIPLFLAEHVVGTRVYHALSGVRVDYEFVVRALWVTTPWVGARQAVALVVVWAHGCLGLHFWLRYRAWYPRAAPWLLIAAVLFPVLALLGFSDAGKAVQAMAPEPLPRDVDQARIDLALAWKAVLVPLIYGVAAASLAAVLGLRVLRHRRECRDLIEVRYEGGQLVRVPVGASVLEASRIGGIPHYSVCGGKGRCSTCRVRVTSGLDEAPPAGPVERATLHRIHAETDVRLACQLRPTHGLTVAPLLAPDFPPALPLGTRPATPGREKEIAILFCDIRGFTEFADHRLPYDVVFLLNRYFAVVGKAVEQAGGQMDKFIGDGAMALFGLDAPKADACRQALEAAAAILAEFPQLGQELAGRSAIPLRVAIGIHAGPAIVGAMGYGGVMNVTAIGDTVNVASRLEAVAKEFDAAIVVSDAAAALSGLDLTRYEVRTIEIRGSAKPLAVRVVPQDAVFAPTPMPKPVATLSI